MVAERPVRIRFCPTACTAGTTAVGSPGTSRSPPGQECCSPDRPAACASARSRPRPRPGPPSPRPRRSCRARAPCRPRRSAGSRAGRTRAGGGCRAGAPAGGRSTGTASTLSSPPFSSVIRNMPIARHRTSTPGNNGSPCMQHERVERVAVLAERVLDVAVVGRVLGRGEQRAVQPHAARRVIDLVLVAAPPGDLDQDVELHGGSFVGAVTAITSVTHREPSSSGRPRRRCPRRAGRGAGRRGRRGRVRDHLRGPGRPPPGARPGADTERAAARPRPGPRRPGRAPAPPAPGPALVAPPAERRDRRRRPRPEPARADRRPGQRCRRSTTAAATSRPPPPRRPSCSTPRPCSRCAAPTDRLRTTVSRGAAAVRCVLVGGGDPTLTSAAAGRPAPLRRRRADHRPGRAGAPGRGARDAARRRRRAVHRPDDLAGLGGRGRAERLRRRDHRRSSPTAAAPHRATASAAPPPTSPPAGPWRRRWAGRACRSCAAGPRPAPGSWPPCRRPRSATLVQQMLLESDNVIAECLARQIALAEKLPAVVHRRGGGHPQRAAPGARPRPRRRHGRRQRAGRTRPRQPGRAGRRAARRRRRGRACATS